MAEMGWEPGPTKLQSPLPRVQNVPRVFEKERVAGLQRDSPYILGVSLSLPHAKAREA